MGWGATAKTKRGILNYGGGVRKLIGVKQGLTEFKTVVVDVNAVLRSKFGYNTTHSNNEISPMSVARQFFKSIVATYPRATTFVFCFDSSHLIPKERELFYKSDRYKPATRAPKPDEIVGDDMRIYKACDAPLSSELVAQITPAHVPNGASGSVVWSKIWNSSVAKARLWRVLSMCIIDVIEEHINQKSVPNVAQLLGMEPESKSKRFIVDDPDGTRHVFPDCNTEVQQNAWKNWGEADTKCYHWAITFGTEPETSPVCIDTIDWDMLIQVIVHAVPSVSVNIGTLYYNDGTEYYSSASSKKAANGSEIERRYELIMCSQMENVYGSRSQRLHAMFWCLCCGGVDYCKGLCRFGFNEQFLMEMINPNNLQTHLFLEENFNSSTFERELIFYPQKFVKTLIMAHKKVLTKKRKRAPSSVSVSEFSHELRRILFCVLYYLGWDPERARGGPELICDDEDNQMFPCDKESCKHEVFDLLGLESHVAEKIVYREEYPANPDMYIDRADLYNVVYSDIETPKDIGSDK